MKKIKFYKEVHELEDEKIKEMIRMTPAERIKNTVELIKRIYPFRTKISDKKKINIPG